MSDYDVIVIGSGAGGGTLVRRLASTGKRILLLERGDWLRARAGELGRPRGVRRQPLRVRGHLVRREGQAVPAAGPLLRGRRDQALRRGALPPARRGLRRAAAPRRHLPRLADRLRRDGAVLHARRAALPGPRGARRGPDRAAGERALPVPGGQPRAAHPAARPTTSRRPATIRSTRPAASCSTRRTCRSAAACAAPPATASRASCTRSPTPRCSAVRPALEHPNVTLLTNAEARAAGDERDGHGRHRRRRASATAPARRSRATSSSSPAARRTAPSCCSRRRATPTPAGSPTARTRSAATTCSTTARPCWRSRRSRTRPSSRRRSGSTTSTSAPAEVDFPLGNIQMVGKSVGADVPRREADPDQARPGAHARRGRAPRGRLLALDGGPAAAGEPRDAARRTGASRSPTRPTNERAEEAALPRAQVDARAPRHAPRPPASRATPTSRTRSRSPASRTRPGPAASAPTRRRSVLNTRLPGARGRQPLRRRHELLPEHRRGQPGADGDGERAAGRRPHRGADRRPGRPVGAGACLRTPTAGATSSSSAAASPASRARGGWPSRTTSTSRCSTATTTTSSSRCSTRWRPASSRRPTSRPRCARSSASGQNVDVKLEDVVGLDPAARTVTTADGREYSRRRRRAGGRLAAELLPHARRGRARVPALLARRRHAPALADPRRVRGRRPQPAR